MKQYVHPNKRFIASCYYEPSSGYLYYAVNTKFGDEISVSSLICNESDLPSLGFIEKEEEPDMDTKCIPNYIRGKTYMEGEVVECKNCGGDCTDKRTPRCPQTDTKWIDNAYMYFKSAKKDHPEMAIDVFKRAILSYLPKQWKTQATHEK